MNVFYFILFVVASAAAVDGVMIAIVKEKIPLKTVGDFLMLPARVIGFVFGKILSEKIWRFMEQND